MPQELNQPYELFGLFDLPPETQSLPPTLQEVQELFGTKPREIAPQPERQGEAKRGRSLKVFAGGAAICTVILLIYGILQLCGFSFLRVVTDSMGGEIPEGSFVVAKRADEQEIQIGDNIAYRGKDGRIITHKVVGIIENCGATEYKGYDTQGVNNQSPDAFTVIYPQVVGKVLAVYPTIGMLIWLLQRVIPAAAVIMAALLIICVAKNKRGGKNA
jgi:signal peptidase I